MRPARPWPAWCFWVPAGAITAAYLLFIIALIVADIGYVPPWKLWSVLEDPYLRFSIKLSLISCTITAVLCLWVSVPAGYVFSRWRPKGRWGRLARGILEGVMDIPIILPPLVIGISLLIFFRGAVGRFIEDAVMPFTYEVAGLVLAQFVVGCAFAIRAMRTTFDHIPERPEQVARTLGASRTQAFWTIAFPSAQRGMVSAATIAWARSLGEFGPVLVFAGATRMKTEVLPTSVFLELSVGNLNSAVAVSILIVIMAVAVLVLVRMLGERGASHDRV
jgi:molybdate transport system permease protein